MGWLDCEETEELLDRKRHPTEAGSAPIHEVAQVRRAPEEEANPRQANQGARSHRTVLQDRRKVNIYSYC